MKATELRIGNWVHHKSVWSHRQDKNHQDLIEFDYEWEESDFYAIGECLMDMDNIDPIPLTEKWVVEFGWVRFDGDMLSVYCYEFNTHEWVKIYKANGVFYFKSDGVAFHCLEHVHQLQNLFHSLTLKELTKEL